MPGATDQALGSSQRCRAPIETKGLTHLLIGAAVRVGHELPQHAGVILHHRAHRGAGLVRRERRRTSHPRAQSHRVQPAPNTAGVPEARLDSSAVFVIATVAPVHEQARQLPERVFGTLAR